MAIFTNTVSPYKTERAFRKRLAQSNKEVNQVAWHMLTRQFAVCHRAWMELKAKLWTHQGNRHCSDTAQEAFSDSCNTDYIVWRPIKGENDESSHAGRTQCTNGSGQMVGERGGAPGILKTRFRKLSDPILNKRHTNSFVISEWVWFQRWQKSQLLLLHGHWIRV